MREHNFYESQNLEAWDLKDYFRAIISSLCAPGPRGVCAFITRSFNILEHIRHFL